MPDVPDLPDPLPEVPAAPSPAEALAPSLDLLGESRARVDELERLRRRVAHLEAAHQQAIRDYRAELDYAIGKMHKNGEDATRARNEADVMALALRELVDSTTPTAATIMTDAQHQRYLTARRCALEVLSLWGRKS